MANTKSKAPKPRKQMTLGSMGQAKDPKPKQEKPAVPAWRTKMQRVLQKQMDSMTKTKSN
jgi:hypothetical protein